MTDDKGTVLGGDRETGDGSLSPLCYAYAASAGSSTMSAALPSTTIAPVLWPGPSTTSSSTVMVPLIEEMSSISRTVR